ncbi:YciI family protein [Prescottella equi]
MPFFLVTYVHPDSDDWRTYLAPHLTWIASQIEAGVLRASGPTFTGAARSTSSIFESFDRSTLLATLATDPYVEAGLMSEMTITQWDPIFGIFNEGSSQRGHTTEQIVSDVLATSDLPSPDE